MFVHNCRRCQEDLTWTNTSTAKTKSQHSSRETMVQQRSNRAGDAIECNTNREAIGVAWHFASERWGMLRLWNVMRYTARWVLQVSAFVQPACVQLLKCFKFKFSWSNNILRPLLSLCKYERFTVWVSSCRGGSWCSPQSSWSNFAMTTVTISSRSYPERQDFDSSCLSQTKIKRLNKSWLQ